MPKKLKDYLIGEIKSKKFGYTQSIGTEELRSKIKEHYKKKYNINVSIDNIAVTGGASAGIFMSLISLFDVGSVVAITQPGYPAYKNIINAIGLKPYFINTNFYENFQINVKHVEKLPNYIKGIIISSPSNPCGTTIPNKEFKKIIEVCKIKRIKIISDEIYHGIDYFKKKLKTAYNTMIMM